MKSLTDEEKIFEAFSDYTNRIDTYAKRQLILSKRMRELVTLPYFILKQVALRNPEMKIDNVPAVEFVNIKCYAVKNWLEECDESIDNLISYNEEMLEALKEI